MTASPANPSLVDAAVQDPELINPPRQARSRRTLDRIVGATRDLLRERDFGDITVDEIVGRAGSSKGSFYQRFEGKDALLVHLLRLEHGAAMDRWSAFLEPARWIDVPPGDFLDAFIDRLMDIYRGTPTFMRAYAGEVFHGGGEIRRLSGELNRTVLEGLRRILREKSGELAHPDPDRAAAFLLTTLITLLPPLFLSPTQDLFPEPISPDSIEQEVRILARSYLGSAGLDGGGGAASETAGRRRHGSGGTIL
jgi:AcrR family transcriptional regulator